MSEQKTHYPQRRSDVNAFMGWFKEFFQQFQLAWQLMVDQRVSWLTKLVPLATVAYVAMPIDMVPDLALGLGQLDDLAIFLIGLRLFIDLCPPTVVREHQLALNPPDDDLPASPWQTPTAVVDVEVQTPRHNEVMEIVEGEIVEKVEGDARE